MRRASSDALALAVVVGATPEFAAGAELWPTSRCREP
jgi:hypothetical protein